MDLVAPFLNKNRELFCHDWSKQTCYSNVFVDGSFLSWLCMGLRPLSATDWVVLRVQNFLFKSKAEDSPLKAVDFGLSEFYKPGKGGLFSFF